jgi:hypothetical protein
VGGLRSHWLARSDGPYAFHPTVGAAIDDYLADHAVHWKPSDFRQLVRQPVPSRASYQSSGDISAYGTSPDSVNDAMRQQIATNKQKSHRRDREVRRHGGPSR